MNHNIPTRTTFAEIYDVMLGNLMFHPHYITSPRGFKIKERLNESYAIINPRSNLFVNNERSIPKKYLAGELLWYFTGDNKLETISKYSGFWSNIANTDGTLNSAYGDLLFTRKNEAGVNQWQWAYNQLVKDKDSRQAIMYFGRPDFQKFDCKDFVCTCFGQFFIRDNTLSLHITMRSNDIIKGTTFDIPFFTLLQQNMYLLLREVYPDLKLGNYIHNVMSLHLYERDFELADKMIKTEFIPSDLPVMDLPLVNKDGGFLGLNKKDNLHNWILTNSN